jgi:hypothetical protein
LELHRIVAWVAKNFQLGDVRRCRALASMCWGLMRAGVVSFAAIGRCMPGPATAASCIRRVFRFCHNSAIDPRAIQAALVKLLVGRAVGCTGTANQLVMVSIDWHTYDNGDVCGLRVSLVTGSRALPLLWYETKMSELGGQQAELERQALEDLILYRPPGVTWVALLDSGFHSSELIALLEEVGYYIVRQPIRMLIHSPHACWTQLGDLPVKLGQIVDFGWVHWTTVAPRKVRIVATRFYEGERPRRGRRCAIRRPYGCTKPGLCVVATNLPNEDFDAIAVIRMYARRFEIEHSFRDLKNATLGMDMEHVHLVDVMTYSRLMCIVAVTEALLWLNGAAAEAHALHLHYTPSRPRNHRRVLSLRRLGQLCLGKISSSINGLIRNYLRPAIATSLSTIGATWREATEYRELRHRAIGKEGLPPLPRACRRWKKGGRPRCCPTLNSRLTVRVMIPGQTTCAA